MSKKSELINVLTGYKSQYESIQAKVININQSDEYTEQGREQAIDKIVTGFKPTAQQCHDKAVSIIDSGLEAMAAKWRANSAGKLSDAGYQMGLANVLRMLESDAIHDREDMQNIVDTYKGDFNALATIANLIQSSSHSMEFMGLIPKDNREYNKRLLDQLRGNIDNHIDPYTIKHVAKTYNDLGFGVSISLDSMMNFINTRLNDSLELVEEPVTARG